MKRLFGNSPITPAAHVNDTSECWAVHGAKKTDQPASRFFRTANICPHQIRKITKDGSQSLTGAYQGLNKEP